MRDHTTNLDDQSSLFLSKSEFKQYSCHKNRNNTRKVLQPPFYIPSREEVLFGEMQSIEIKPTTIHLLVMRLSINLNYFVGLRILRLDYF